MTNPRFKDLTNQKFGKWKAVKFLGVHPRYKSRIWEVVCECGNTSEVRATQLTQAKTRMCMDCARVEKVIDLTGQRFGKWTVIKRNPEIRKKAYWLCECTCGVKKEIRSTALRSGNSRGCGKCLGRGKRIPMEGRKFGQLIVLRYDENCPKSGFWVVRCGCGLEYSVMGSWLRSGKAKSCHHCHHEELGKSRRKNDQEVILKRKFTDYKRGATLRNLEWSIDRDFFDVKVVENCYYCGCPPCYTKISPGGRAYFAAINGIDRKDNNKGYTKENCVPCCKLCNSFKSNFPVEEFLKHVERICIHQKSKDRNGLQ
jgi:hypothetical protein